MKHFKNLFKKCTLINKFKESQDMAWYERPGLLCPDLLRILLSLILLCEVWNSCVDNHHCSFRGIPGKLTK